MGRFIAAALLALAASHSAQACLPDGIKVETEGGHLCVPDLSCAPAERTWNRWCIDEKCYTDHVQALTSMIESDAAAPPLLSAALYRYRYEDAFGNSVTCIGDRQTSRCFQSESGR